MQICLHLASQPKPFQNIVHTSSRASRRPGTTNLFRCKVDTPSLRTTRMGYCVIEIKHNGCFIVFNFDNVDDDDDDDGSGGSMACDFMHIYTEFTHIVQRERWAIVCVCVLCLPLQQYWTIDGTHSNKWRNKLNPRIHGLRWISGCKYWRNKWDWNEDLCIRTRRIQISVSEEFVCALPQCSMCRFRLLLLSPCETLRLRFWIVLCFSIGPTK